MAGDHGPHRNIVLLNAAAAFVVADRAASLEEGLELASATIDSGAAAAALERLVVESQAARAELVGGEGGVS
jgi:anthranilate phosphoribosyltransferase